MLLKGPEEMEGYITNHKAAHVRAFEEMEAKIASMRTNLTSARDGPSESQDAHEETNALPLGSRKRLANR